MKKHTGASRRTRPSRKSASRPKRSLRVSVRRTDAKPAAPAAPELADGCTKVYDGSSTVPVRWRVMQRAIYLLIEAGKTVSLANIATEVGLSKSAIWKFFRVHPGFLPWLDGEMGSSNNHLVPMLARRHWHIGMQGSVPSAEFFMKEDSPH